MVDTVAPLIAASVMPDVIKALAAMPQSVKDNNLIDYTYQPMVRIRKDWYANDPELRKRFPTGEMPNPRYGPCRIQVPAWLFVIAPIIGVSVYAILMYGVGKLADDIKGCAQGEKDTTLADIGEGIWRTSPIGALGKATGWY